MNGNMTFGEIARLPANWWTTPPPSDPAVVWTVWDKDTCYLWGANVGNYQNAIGTSLSGDGMAGPLGPTRGYAHPHYVGVITMDFTQMPSNDGVFAGLTASVKAQKNVVVPIFPDSNLSATGCKLSLGTGIGSPQPNWGGIQKYILQKIHDLGSLCANVEFPTASSGGNCDGLYWPDLRPTTPPSAPPIHAIKSLADLRNIIDNVL